MESPAQEVWHALDLDEAAARLGADIERGLSAAEARARLERFGPNRLQVQRRLPALEVLRRQFANVLILILLLAAVASLALGETIDAAAILAIVALNAALGFLQEWKAEQAVAELQRLLSPRCRVVRDGLDQVIDAADLVPGDLVRLETGDRVAADLRLVTARELKADESTLTGESVAVPKQVQPVAAVAPLAERPSMAWMGTAVTCGSASGMVVATGADTHFGGIAHLTGSIREEATPLSRKLDRLARQLGVAAVAVAAVLILAGWLAGKPLFEMFFTGVALAVAVVPEGLPAVVTITLAFGVRAMAKRRALIRRLQAVETLGAATVICTDKTGTLTQNQMTVREVWLAGGSVEISGTGYEPRGEFTTGGKTLNPRTTPALMALLETGATCNRALLVNGDGGRQVLGEPTEAALLVAAEKAGIAPADAQRDSEIVAELAFTSERKRMTVVRRSGSRLLAHSKGAPEAILERCSRILDGDREVALEPRHRRAIDKAHEEMACRGLRTLALARRALADDSPLTPAEVERDLTLLGITGILDPPRPEVAGAMALARRAGLRIIMVTGDAPGTARAIADRIQLPVSRVVRGAELSDLDDATLSALLEEDVLFARTEPEHKLRLVRLLSERGEIVAMTGDGVNDAPALKRAAIGIAMGQRGTDVARSASDMVLADDNFTSIVNAVEEGRRQHDNILKFVRYLLSSNVGEVVAIFVNVLLGGPLILLPVQILWMNLVTDSLTAVALGVEPAEPGIMERPPRPPQKPILDRFGLTVVVSLGTYIGAATLWLFHHALAGGNLELARTMAFTGIILAEKVNVLNFRSLHAPMGRIGWLSNPWVLLAVGGTVGLQALAVYAPPLQRLLHTTALEPHHWLMMVAAALPLFLLREASKIWQWRRSRRAEQ